ncbi:unnamed protein product [Clonostachys byssicola]|uniref:Phosphatidylglycerol/phosphatidylinositol transfer protein n=1 Tax=Clonostachys byssicola TaxID=160290 RepID=A0A9N9YA48_9HYPO|nr:unnamed protein product [Clonostachys byssicola]
MKFSAAWCLPALLAPTLAASIANGNAPLVTRNDDLAVPGESPLEFCDGDRASHLVIIDKVDLSPNPPAAGQDLVIKAEGTVKEKIEEGAYVSLAVNYGLIRLITTTADLCEQIGNVDLECPVEAGKLAITKTVELPAQIPPGTYTVVADVFAADKRRITCLKASVTFGRPGFFNNEL